MPSRANIYFYIGAVIIAAILIAGAVHNHNQHKPAPKTPTTTSAKQ